MTLDIVGAGIVTAHGSGRAHVFGGMLRGEVAVRIMRHRDPASFRCQHAYEIADESDGGTVRPLRSTQWLLEVVAAAMDEAGLEPGRDHIAVLVGTGLREQASLELWSTHNASFSIADWDYRKALRDRFGPELEVHSFVNACAASLCCLSLAEDMLALDEADAVIVAGTDSIASSMYGLLDRANGTPPERIQPFDRHRKGVIMGEGAAAIALVRESGGRPVLGTLRAAVQNCDGRHETAPDRDSIANVIRMAHREAGVQPDQVDLIMTHGTGTQLNDEAEAWALFEVYGDAAGRVLLSGVKGMTGHTAGASGLVSLVTGLEIMRTGRVPPAPGLSEPIEGARRFDIVAAARDNVDVARIQVNAFGFGGVNAVAIVDRADVP